MNNLSISRAWTETLSLAAREFRLLYPIAFLLMSLPPLLLNLIVPDPGSERMPGFEMFVVQIGLWPFILIMIGIFLVLIALQTYGSLAIAHLALRPGTSVGEGLAAAARRLPPVFGAVLLIALAVVLLIFLLVLMLVGSDWEAPRRGSPGPALLPWVLILLFVAGSARLLPLTPAGAVEPLGPISVLVRSWQLTAGYFWKLYGALLLMGIAFLIVAGVVGLGFGFVTMGLVGNPLYDFRAAFVLELLNSLFGSAAAVFGLVFATRVYAQLSGRVNEMEEVFS